MAVIHHGPLWVLYIKQSQHAQGTQTGTVHRGTKKMASMSICMMNWWHTWRGEQGMGKPYRKNLLRIYAAKSHLPGMRYLSKEPSWRQYLRNSCSVFLFQQCFGGSATVYVSHLGLYLVIFLLLMCNYVLPPAARLYGCACAVVKVILIPVTSCLCI